MDEDQEQRQAQQGQEQSKQGKQVRFGDEQQLGKGAENAGEPEVMRKNDRGTDRQRKHEVKEEKEVGQREMMGDRRV